MIQHYANKKKRNELESKSILCYGKKHHYRKVMMNNALDIEQIEGVLDLMIKRIGEWNGRKSEEIKRAVSETTIQGSTVTDVKS